MTIESEIQMFTQWVNANNLTVKVSKSNILVVIVMGVGSRGGRAPSIFKHDTNIVDKGLKVLFFGLLCYFFFFPVLPLRKRLNSDILWSFLLFFGLFFVPPWKIFCRRPWL